MLMMGGTQEFQPGLELLVMVLALHDNVATGMGDLAERDGGQIGLGGTYGGAHRSMQNLGRACNWGYLDARSSERGKLYCTCNNTYWCTGGTEVTIEIKWLMAQ